MRVVSFAPSLGVEDMAQLQGICLGSTSAWLQCSTECFSGIHQQGAGVLAQYRMLGNTGFQFHSPHSQRKENLLLTTNVLEGLELLTVCVFTAGETGASEELISLEPNTQLLKRRSHCTERPPEAVLAEIASSPES